MKVKDLAAGSTIQIGGSKFVAIGGGQFMAAEPITFCNDGMNIGEVKDFNYTGGEVQLETCSGSTYKLEVWGGAGGTSGTNIGGYGGYAVGTYTASSDEILYINVGGEGVRCASGKCSGGYNGGGWAKYNSGRVPGSGGGATHIAIKSGTLALLSAYQNTGGTNVSKEILIVAAGGGGASQGGDSHNPGRGGHGGGYIGNAGVVTGAYSYRHGEGATQTAGGAPAANACVDANVPERFTGDFGLGAVTATNINAVAYHTAGGGSGWYGGGSDGCAGPSGGGSGYIGSSNLTSSNGITKHMTCYSCATSTAEDTYTQSNTCVNATATANCSKTGNGYARITRLN